MNRRTTVLAPVALVAALWSASAAPGPPQDTSDTREIGRTTEKELKVTLTSSFGSVTISRGEPEKMVIIGSARRHHEDPAVGVDYSIRNRIGYM
ncbi:MAG TPA: hypothetical protein VMF59_05485, partial [Bacteroidota bacterium]|nr:hypothetical protein [Bacteroidota bacterium]